MALFPMPGETPRSRLKLRLLHVFSNTRLVRLALSVAAFFLLAILLVWHGRDGVAKHLPFLGFKETNDYYQFTTFSDYSPVTLDPAGKTTEELCATFPKHLLNLVQPVLKMGHGENHNKIEAQLDSVSACFSPDDLLIFSDLDETIKGHHIIDILANLPYKYYNESYNPDIKSYLKQKQMRDTGTLGKDQEETGKIDGWILDKFKFLPQIERAWLLKPERPFYFFYESDTYVVWENVFRFLSTFDPDTPIYMGSPSPGRHDRDRDIKTWFANGGPGFVLSREAVKTLIHRNVSANGQYMEPSTTEKYLDLITIECCGDSVLGWALWNAGIALQGYWPMFNPHPLHGIPYSDRHWCQPILTLHKTLPKDMIDVWRWEFGQRKQERPLLYSDFWNFQHPGTPGVLDNWDNGEVDSWWADLNAGIDSFEKCEEACKKEDGCFQWNWRGEDEQKCALVRSIRYGGAKQPGQTDEEKKVSYKAGWRTEKIEKWRNDHQCSSVEWVGPSITRIF